uniref:Uncharacterized protein n=1 Tax=Fagus sylvatica TaxID=28930 RepID=A0A2N9F8X6_FAGSY
MRHIVGKLSTSSFQRYKVCANRSSDEGVMAPGSRGIGAVFVHSSDAKIPIKRGMLIGEPRVPRRSRSHYLSNAPGLADQLVASRKDSAREGGSCAAYFCKVPDSRESELGLVRYGPASRVHRGVFGPFEGSFPIRIPADPDKFLAIREFHVVHGCVLFPMCPGSQINLLRVRKTLCASVATSVGKFPETFSKTLFRRPVFTRVVDVAPDVGFRRSWYRRKACVTYFLTVQALHRGELGFARYDPANGGRRNVPYAKGGGQFDPVFGLVNGPVKPWSNLVNLGQTWSDLVKALQTLGNVPRTSFQGFLGKADPSRAGNSSVKPRSNFGRFVPESQISFRDLGGHPGRFVPDSSPFRDLGGHPGRFVPESQISFRDLGGHPGRFVPDSSPFRDLGGHPGRFVPESQISFRDLGGHPGRFVPDSSPFRDLGGHPGRFVPESQFSFRDLGGHPGRFVPDSSVSRPGWSPRPIRPRFVSVSRPGWSPRPIRTQVTIFVSKLGWSPKPNHLRHVWTQDFKLSNLPQIEI